MDKHLLPVRLVSVSLVVALSAQSVPIVAAQDRPIDPGTETSPRRIRLVDSIPTISAPLDARQTMLLALYLGGPERERVSMASAYLADQYARSLTPVQVAEIQRNYDRASLNMKVGSVEEGRWLVDIYTKLYDEAHAQVGPQLGINEW